jgi:hypothetical protein
MKDGGPIFLWKLLGFLKWRRLMIQRKLQKIQDTDPGFFWKLYKITSDQMHRITENGGAWYFKTTNKNSI